MRRRSALVLLGVLVPLTADARRRPPPPPPPVDDTAVRAQRTQQALESLDGAVQDCADRIGVANSVTEIKASVTLIFRAVRIEVADVGNATFRQCVRRRVTVRTAANFLIRPAQPVTVSRVFSVAGGTAGMPPDRAAIEQLVRQEVRNFAHCIEPEAARPDYLDATIKVTVDPSGEFRGVQIVRPRRTEAAATCILAVIGRHAPPPFAGGATTVALDLNGG